MLIITSASNPMARGVVSALQAQQQVSSVTWVVAVVLLVAFGLVLWWWWRKNYKEERKPGPSETHIEEGSIPVTGRPVEVQQPSGVVPSEPLMPDNLTLIEGIGPKIQGLLQDVGITTFAQLVDADVEYLVKLLKGAGLHMVDPETWKEQARLAAEGKWEQLETLQHELKAGHRV